MTLPPVSFSRRASIVGVAAVAVLGLAGCGSTDANRDEATGEITEAANASVDQIKVGDCFDYEAMGSLVSDVDTIPCGDPHTGEIYAEIELPAGDFPDDLDEQADAFCAEEFEAFVGVSYDTSQLYLTYLSPNQSGWESYDDRVVQCIIIDQDPETGDLLEVTGSLEAAGR